MKEEYSGALFNKDVKCTGLNIRVNNKMKCVMLRNGVNTIHLSSAQFNNKIQFLQEFPSLVEPDDTVMDEEEGDECEDETPGPSSQPTNIIDLIGDEKEEEDMSGGMDEELDDDEEEEPLPTVTKKKNQRIVSAKRDCVVDSNSEDEGIPPKRKRLTPRVTQPKRTRTFDPYSNLGDDNETLDLSDLDLDLE